MLYAKYYHFSPIISYINNTIGLGLRINRKGQGRGDICKIAHSFTHPLCPIWVNHFMHPEMWRLTFMIIMILHIVCIYYMDIRTSKNNILTVFSSQTTIKPTFSSLELKIKDTYVQNVSNKYHLTKKLLTQFHPIK